MIKEKFAQLLAIADKEGDSDEVKQQHTFLIYLGSLMSLGGLLWGSIALYSELYWQALLPYSYTLITIISFTFLYFYKHYEIAKTLQLYLSLLLPFSFQLSLGGFIASGGMVLWSVLAVFGSFTISQSKETIKWLVLFLLFVAIAGILDQYVRDIGIDVPDSISVLFFSINVTVVSSIVFTLYYYFVNSEQKLKQSLYDSYNSLKNAQEQLVEAEKMSALGSLVAGVAHEVNTPLGISITASSIFKREVKNLEEEIAHNRLTRGKLESFMQDVLEAEEILSKNLYRAAELIKNFKKISVDQSSEMARQFELNKYIKEAASTITNEFRIRKVELAFDLYREKILIYSYPGYIAQIVVNMLQNALLHAFDEDEIGRVIISTERFDTFVRIRFKDNGKGISEEVKDTIFEPFVTTKRNKGGTGLGLNITYNLVNARLNGRIYVESDLNVGTSFVIEIPYNIDETEVNFSI